VQQQGIWGVADHHKNSIGKVEIGDKLLFYVIGESSGQNRLEPAITGLAEAASEVFRDRKEIFRSGSVKSPSEIFPLRIKLSNLIVLKEEIPFKPFIPSLEFIKNKKKWSGHIQGLAMRMIPRDDFEKLAEVIKS